MNNFDVDSYSSFNRGAIVVDNSVKKLSNNIEKAKASANKLNTDEVFVGPICASFIDQFVTIENVLKNATSKLAIAKAFLSLVDTNYQESDNKNSSDIGGV